MSFYLILRIMEDFGMKKKLIVLMIAVSMSFSTDILAAQEKNINDMTLDCLLYTSPSPRD